jgi:hypothetical protein
VRGTSPALRFCSIASTIGAEINSRQKRKENPMDVNPQDDQVVVCTELNIKIANHNQTVARPTPRIGLNHNQTNIRIANHNQTVVRPRVTANHNQTAVRPHSFVVVVVGEPGLATNHNQTLVRPVPGINPNHNQTLVRSRLSANHNQTVVRTAPGIHLNHNQTLVRG